MDEHYLFEHLSGFYTTGVYSELVKGDKLFRGNAVKSVERKSTFSWEATIIPRSREFHISIEVNEKSTISGCSCKSITTHLCRHKAAALLAILQSLSFEGD